MDAYCNSTCIMNGGNGMYDNFGIWCGSHTSTITLFE